MINKIDKSEVLYFIRNIFFEKWYFPVGFFIFFIFLQYIGVVTNDAVISTINIMSLLWLIIFSIVQFYKRKWITGCFTLMIVLLYVFIAVVFGLLILFMDYR